MTQATRRSDHKSDVRVNVDSVHIPVAVAVWQLPKLLMTLASITAGGIAGLVMLFIAVMVLSESPMFNTETRAKSDKLKSCYNELVMNDPDADTARVLRYCQSFAGF